MERVPMMRPYPGDYRKRVHEVKKELHRSVTVCSDRTTKGYENSRKLFHNLWRKIGFVAQGFQFVKEIHSSYTLQDHEKDLNRLLLIMKKNVEASRYLGRNDEVMQMCKNIIEVVGYNNMPKTELVDTYTIMSGILFDQNEYSRAREISLLGLEIAPGSVIFREMLEKTNKFFPVEKRHEIEEDYIPPIPDEEDVEDEPHSESLSENEENEEEIAEVHVEEENIVEDDGNEEIILQMQQRVEYLENELKNKQNECQEKDTKLLEFSSTISGLLSQKSKLEREREEQDVLIGKMKDHEKKMKNPFFGYDAGGLPSDETELAKFRAENFFIIEEYRKKWAVANENIIRKEMECQMEKKNSNLLNCGVCMERVTQVAFQCGHLVCLECSEQISECPYCRKKIVSRLRIFRV